MQLTEMAYKIGQLESGLAAMIARGDDRWSLVMMLLKRQGNGNGNGHGRKIPWMQLAAMATVALTSLLGIITPERAATILRALLH